MRFLIMYINYFLISYINKKFHILHHFEYLLKKEEQ